MTVKKVFAMDWSRIFDVLVVGGGNAALCAAMTARRHRASVLVLESAPVAFRGGNPIVGDGDILDVDGD